MILGYFDGIGSPLPTEIQIKGALNPLAFEAKVFLGVVDTQYPLPDPFLELFQRFQVFTPDAHKELAMPIFGINEKLKVNFL